MGRKARIKHKRRAVLISIYFLGYCFRSDEEVMTGRSLAMKPAGFRINELLAWLVHRPRMIAS